MPLRHLVCAFAVMSALAAPAAAQDAGRVGVTMGYPGAVGVVWHLTDGIALRPDVSVTRGSSESTTTGTFTGGFGGTPTSSTTMSEGWSTTVGLSALFTVKTIERLRIYLTPRLAWSHSSTDSEAGVTGGLSSFDVTTRGFITSASVGTQYGLHDRFAVFGELGAQYSDLDTRSVSPGTRNRSNNTTLGLRSAVGVIVYF